MQIDLAYPWTDAKGKTHAPDKTVNVDADTAQRLIEDGRARPHSDDPAPAEPKPVKIDLAYPWTDPDGKVYAPDDTVPVHPDTAANLIAEGRARPHNADSSAASPAPAAPAAPKSGRAQADRNDAPTGGRDQEGSD